MKRKEDKIKIRMMSHPMVDDRDRVSIEKIDNGYVVSTCGYDSKEKRFIKDLCSAPSIVARLMGGKSKNYRQLKESIDVEEEEGK